MRSQLFTLRLNAVSLMPLKAPVKQLPHKFVVVTNLIKQIEMHVNKQVYITLKKKVV